jgi:Uma2 family endonuclease
VDVLSPGTASIDRREKRLAYTRLPSLEQYIVVDQGRMRADVYGREGAVGAQHPARTGSVDSLQLPGLRGDAVDGVEAEARAVEEALNRRAAQTEFH